MEEALEAGNGLVLTQQAHEDPIDVLEDQAEVHTIELLGSFGGGTLLFFLGELLLHGEELRDHDDEFLGGEVSLGRYKTYSY
jgi:hypothetical protein